MKIDQIEKALSTLRTAYGDSLKEKEIAYIENSDDGVKIVFESQPLMCYLLPEQQKKIRGFRVRFPNTASLFVDTTSREYALRYAISRLVVTPVEGGP